ncbi:putative transposable element [Trichonephila clavipes]|nr:putative transposable element [Trichonephila clavipes]
MITNFFIPELNNRDVEELWFQQNGATCHTARATIDLLKDTFGDRLISRFGPVNWPPRSCDLTPLDYFLWGYVKSMVYADKPQTLDHLEDNIRRVIADIRPQMLEKVIENWTSRLDHIRASRGSPMPEIIFKMYTPPDHNWIAASHPGHYLSYIGPRALQSALSKFRSGHLRLMKFQNGRRIFPPRSCSLPGSSSHPPACLGASLRSYHV